MLMRSDPFRELDRLTQQVWGNGRSPMLAMDAYRSGDQFFVAFDVPGIDPGSIELTVEKNVLTVSATRSWQPGDGDEVLIAERSQGSFSRQVFLSEGLDAEHISANYDHGVLTIVIPMSEHAKPRKVEITASNGKRTAIGAASRES